MNRRSFAAVERRSRVLLITAYLWFGTGCATYHIYQVGGPDGRELGNQPSTEWRNKTLHTLFWGAIRQGLSVDSCRLCDGTRTQRGVHA